MRRATSSLEKHAIKMKPPTFEELLKRTTPGPYMHLPYDRGIYTRLNDGCRGMPLAYIPTVTPEHEANAELIVRLLAFASAGGVEKIKAVIAELDDLIENEACGKHSRYQKELTDAAKGPLSLLDGAAVPGSHYEEKK